MLRYLKSVFPTVEEYLLLDVLANSENNVQKTADKYDKIKYISINELLSTMIKISKSFLITTNI